MISAFLLLISARASARSAVHDSADDSSSPDKVPLGSNPCLCSFADSPRRLWWYHWLCWALSMVGMFCILLAHDHYTVDVVVAYYITTRLFWWYHTMANQQVSSSTPWVLLLYSGGWGEYPSSPLSCGESLSSPSHWVCRGERGIINLVLLVS